MTREVKLSLILGFAVVLGVGVLLSDHLSGARQARTEGLDPARGIVPVTAATPAPNENPGLILVDEFGRPEAPPAKPAPSANPRPGVVQPVRVAGAGRAFPAESGGETMLERMRSRAGEALASAATDLVNGQTPPSAARLATDEETIRFDGVQPVERSEASIPMVQTASEDDRAEASPEPAGETYDVRDGDTLWSIASRMLGDGKRHKEIVELNRDRIGAGNTLRIGTTLRLPARSTQARADSPRSVEGRPAVATRTKNGRTVYKVKSGDTLGGIAAKYLGSSAKYDQLLLANAGTLKDEDSLEVGMELLIPGR
jgi:nucleoid-associated protein YgaU